MGVNLAHILVFAAAIAAPAGSAVTANGAASSFDKCHVVGSEKLPKRVNSDSICSAIAEAMASKAPSLHYDVEVQVLSKSRLSAVLVVNGRSLPAENMAVSDGEVGPSSIKRFAGRLGAVAATI